MTMNQKQTPLGPLTPNSLKTDLRTKAGHGSRFTAPQSIMPSMATLLNVVDAWKRANQVVVFTNGCFDLFHPGHARLLLECSNHGTRLVVGINSDESVKRLKGDGRPVIPLIDRMLMVASQKPVDAVIVFEEETPESLICAVRPHVLCKGEKDFKSGERYPIPGARQMEDWAGRVVAIPCKTPYSTTGMIEWMQSNK